jgi:hypothetical protein
LISFEIQTSSIFRPVTFYDFARLYQIIYNSFNYEYKKIPSDDLIILSKNYLPEILNNKQFILNPLSVIIKLSILSFKPICTKIHIQNNVIYFQEPGIFQSLTRYIFKSNKSHLQYLYYPIKIACNKYLTKEFIKKYPKIKYIFISAKNGIENLMKTYSSCALTTLCLKYYHVIIFILKFDYTKK